MANICRRIKGTENEKAALIRRTIFERRSQLNLNQVELARKAGLSQSTIVTIERGIHRPRLDTFLMIINSLDMDICFVVPNGLKISMMKLNISTENLYLKSKSHVDETEELILKLIFHRRTELGITQDELAKKIGRTKSHILRLQYRQSSLSLATTLRLLEALRVCVYLLVTHQSSKIEEYD